MGNIKAKRHTHKYHKISLNGDKVWACALPDCYHYMPAHQTALVLGKRSICWGESQDCEETLILDAGNMTLDRPMCDICITSDIHKTVRKEHTVEETDEFYKNLLKKAQ